MTPQSPRIYIYKITFEEVLYYYYGVHKEKKFGEYYMGSPETHKWMWDFYTPKKQRLEIFPFTDEGWIKAQEVEGRLIRPVYNTDKWCLNESCGGKSSLYIRRKVGMKNKELGRGICGLPIEERKKNSKKLYEEGKGIASISLEERKNISKKVGMKNKELGRGICGLPIEERKKNGKENYKKWKENGTGICSFTPEQKNEIGKKANETNKKNQTGIYSVTPEKRREIGLFCKERGIGIHSLTDDERKELGRKSGKYCKENGLGIFAETKEDRSKRATQTNYQKWMCLETGFITNAGNLSRYQMRKGIDKSKRIRLN